MKLHTLYLLLLLPLSAPAQTLELKPAIETSFLAEAGHFYQVEAAEGEHWKPLGKPIKGAGTLVTQTFSQPSNAQVRVTRLRRQWVPVWSDEFDGKTLNMNNWSHVEDSYGGGNHERQFYSTKPKYSFVKDGKLHLRAYRDAYTTVDGKRQPYTSARIRTLNRGEWKYGKFEIRAKLPNGEGIWPAIWMLPTNTKYGIWAACGEIDIVESRGYDTHMTFGTLHFGDSWPNNTHKGSTYEFPNTKAHEDFHTYTTIWEKDEIRWYVDGKKWQTIKKEDWWSSSAEESNTAPFDEEFHLILNLAVGGGNFFEGTNQNPDNMKDSQFPQTMLVDYVRVSQWAN